MILTEKVDSKFQRTCIFGPPKSGKTKLALSLAKNKKVTLFDLENGYLVARQFPVEVQKNINVISIPDTRTFPIAIETMLKVIKGGEKKICMKHGKVTCLTCQKDKLPEEVIDLHKLTSEDIVIVDSLTQLTNSGIAHITKNQNEDYKPDWDDWAKLGRLMDTFLSEVQQAPFNIICITHETEAEMEAATPEGNKPIKLVPTAGTRNFSRNTAKYFDHVIYCEVKNKSHKFGSATDYSMGVLTGSRTNVKLEDLKEVSLEAIYK